MWRPGGDSKGKVFQARRSGGCPPYKGISKPLALIPNNIIKNWKYTSYMIFHLSKHIYQSKMTFFLSVFFGDFRSWCCFYFLSRFFRISKRRIFLQNHFFFKKTDFFIYLWILTGPGGSPRFFGTFPERILSMISSIFNYTALFEIWIWKVFCEAKF